MTDSQAEPAPVHVAEIESEGIRVRVEGPRAAPLKLRALDLLEEIKKSPEVDESELEGAAERMGVGVSFDRFTRRYVVTEA